MPKKLTDGTLWDFSTSILSQNCKKKLKGDPLGKRFIFENKSRNAEKLKGGPFSLARYCMLSEKKEKKNWFSSLGQGQFKIL